MTKGSRILLVAPDFPPRYVGGGAYVVQRLAEEYSRRGYGVQVISLDTSRGGLSARPDSSDRPGYRVTYLPVTRRWIHRGIVYSNAMPPSLPAWRYLRGLLRAQEWAGIHLHGVPVFFVDLVAWYARRLRIPYLLTIHGVVQDPRRYGVTLSAVYRAWLALERRLYQRAVAVTAVSEANLDEVRAAGFRSSVLRVVLNAPHPASAESPAAVSEARMADWGIRGMRYALSLGTFIPRKGHSTTIEAVALLRESGALPEDFRVVLAGRDVGGGYREELEREIRDQALSKWVRVLGEVTDEEREMLYKHCAFAACTTLYEAAPMVVVEARVRGCPLVASDIPSIRELVGDRGGVAWFRPGVPTSLAEALRTVLDDPTRLDQLRREAVASQQSGPSWSEIADQYLELLLGGIKERANTPIPEGGKKGLRVGPSRRS